MGVNQYMSVCTPRNLAFLNTTKASFLSISFAWTVMLAVLLASWVDASAMVPRETDQTLTAFRAISTDILHFRARVLVIQAATAAHGRATLIPDTVLPIYSCDRAVLGSPEAVASRRTGPAGPGGRNGGQHALVTRPRRLTGTSRTTPIGWPHRVLRRAAAARAVRSAGTASPVPKYISSGVCPRNAECGSTRLCSST